MKIAHSRLTSRGQVLVPAEVRQRLGLGPGSILEWDADGEHVVVRRGHRYSSADLHSTLFPDGTPTTRSLDELKNGIGRNMAKLLQRVEMPR